MNDIPWINWKYLGEERPEKDQWVLVLENSSVPKTYPLERREPSIGIGRLAEKDDNDFLSKNDQWMGAHYWYPLPEWRQNINKPIHEISCIKESTVLVNYKSELWCCTFHLKESLTLE